MMFRKTTPEDLQELEPNRFTDMARFETTMSEAGAEAYSLVQDGEVKCVVSIWQYHPHCFQSGIAFSEHFTNLDARKLKKFIWRKIEEYCAIRTHTFSEAHPVVDRIHRFLGFNCEGTLRKMMYGQDYRVWSCVYGS